MRYGRAWEGKEEDGRILKGLKRDSKEWDRRTEDAKGWEGDKKGWKWRGRDGKVWERSGRNWKIM